jgi:hypothetical protein
MSLGLLIGLLLFGWEGAAIGGFLGVLLSLAITGIWLMPARGRAKDPLQ